MVTAREIREKFLNFFEKKGHKIIPSASLIPENDPTVLFTTAGMHPLVPYLLGQKHPLGKRLCNSQKCLRTVDIDEVGDATHLTFFEMLGNWSLGDYFKKEAIEWSFEFLTKELEIPLEKLAISVFEGEPANNIPRDEESAKLWQGLGVPKERLAYLGREDNWWGPAGFTGPCGPDTEMFYWTGKEKAPAVFDPSDKRWVEVWNDVFMEYNKKIKNQKSKIKNKDDEYEFVPLKQKNVDTGMGLERITAALQGRDNVFETELFQPIIQEIRNLPHFTPYQDNIPIDKGKPHIGQQPERIIADHLKAATFILAEGITPSKTKRGYVLRRLIRRSIRYIGLYYFTGDCASRIARKVIDIYAEIYPELVAKKDFIVDELRKEEECFKQTLPRGLKQFEKLYISRLPKGQKAEINGKEAFDLYQTYGFPLEITKDLAKERGFFVDEPGFYEELKKHQELSRTASAGKFKSGLGDHSEKTIKYHTATHLLHTALRQVLGEEVEQMGSNITGERLRFDFSFSRKLTNEEIQKVGDLVNQKIKENLEVKTEEMTANEALKNGALAFFRERYPEKVKVYTIFEPKTGEVFSKEICAGPHVGMTSELGAFKIIKEDSSGMGVRRIRAILK